MLMLEIRIPYATIRLAVFCSQWLMIAIVLIGSAARAQETDTQAKEGVPTGLSVEIELQLDKVEQYMASLLEQLQNLQREQKNLQNILLEDQAVLTEAEASGDIGRQNAARDTLAARQADLAALARKIRTTQLLYDQTLDHYRITGERLNLYRDRQKAASAEQEGTVLSGTARRKAEARHAAKEVELTQKEVFSLVQRERVLTARGRALSKEVKIAADKLRADNLSDGARQLIERRRRQLTDEQQAIVLQIADTRQALVKARALQPVLAEKAEQKAAGLSQWQFDLVKSFVLIVFLVLLLMLVRMGVGGRIKDVQRRYYLNHSLSILTVFIVIIGLLVIFVRDLAYLFTGLGVAAAGLAIALQEIISSFFAWFLIQGSRGYRIRDYIRIGDQYGEVLDISLTLTTLGQVSAIDQSGETGGAWTGGLTLIANSAIFKQPIVNFTRGYPFIWCRLTYTITYESDWKEAETLLLEAVNEKEILATAQQAQKKIEGMTRDFAIQVRNTEPVVRTRAAGSGVELILRFLAPPRRRRLLMDKVNRCVLDAVQRSDSVDFAYPTIRTIPTPPEGGGGMKLIPGRGV